jgi:hypothetical protein
VDNASHLPIGVERAANDATSIRGDIEHGVELHRMAAGNIAARWGPQGRANEVGDQDLACCIDGCDAATSQTWTRHLGWSGKNMVVVSAGLIDMERPGALNEELCKELRGAQGHDSDRQGEHGDQYAWATKRQST